MLSATYDAAGIISTRGSATQYMWFVNAVSDEVDSSVEPEAHPASSDESSEEDFAEE